MLPLEPRHLVVPLGASKIISKPVVRSSQTMHLFCTDTNTLQSDQKEIPHDRHDLRVPSGMSKTSFEPMVRYAQTVHLYSVRVSTISKLNDTNIVSKWTEMRFHMTLVTY
jgi:hypothetical protein